MRSSSTVSTYTSSTPVAANAAKVSEACGSSSHALSFLTEVFAPVRPPPPPAHNVLRYVRRYDRLCVFGRVVWHEVLRVWLYLPVGVQSHGKDIAADPHGARGSGRGRCWV
jgi:hypothetical protein